MEQLLQYVWAHRLYTSLVCVSDESFEVIDPGILNTDSGPDFFNAKIRMGQIVLVGNVEIHRKASDWIKHRHHLDAAYDNVILHVVECHDRDICRRSDRQPLLTARMSIPSDLKLRASHILEQVKTPACLQRLDTLDALDLDAWMGTLLIERMRRKVADIERIYIESAGKDWNETTYILLARHLGFGVNNDAFERLARYLPLRYLRKHRDHLLQLEAMLLGAAGLLQEVSDSDEYHARLCGEYRLLSAKFALTSLPSHLFRKHRIRPASFPHVRLAQLAAILHRDERLFHRFLDVESPVEMCDLFVAPPSDYWLSHYSFGQEHQKHITGIPDLRSRAILVANVVCPILMTYGLMRQEPLYHEKAMSLLRSLPAESNKVSRMFSRVGIKARSMAESQALLQLGAHYCKERRCLSCRIGWHWLRGSSVCTL